jgi:hypothetical protein
LKDLSLDVIKIDKNKLFLGNRLILTTQENIEQAEIVDDNGIIVLTDFPVGTPMNDVRLFNLFRYDTSGKLIWKISYATELKRYSFISGFRIVNDKILASDFYGRTFKVDTATGVATMNGITK